MTKLNKKLTCVAAAQVLTVPAILVPALIGKPTDPLAPVKELVVTSNIQILNAIEKNRQIQIRNAMELFNSLYHVTEYIDELERKTTQNIDKAKEDLSKKLEENKQEIKKVFGLTDEVLDLIDKQTDFIDKWFIRAEEYKDHIYTELLNLKEQEIPALTNEIKKGAQDIEAWLRDNWYDSVLSTAKDDLKKLVEEVDKVKTGVSSIWELACLSNHDGILKNTTINLELKDYLLNSCKSYIDNASDQV